MLQRRRFKGPNGDINEDVDLGPSKVYRNVSNGGFVAATLPNAIVPKRSELFSINGAEGNFRRNIRRIKARESRAAAKLLAAKVSP